MAIVRIEKGRPKFVAMARKLSIASVAEEAGVSRASIHNNYPDLAERIRTVTNKATREQRNQKHSALQDVRKKNRELRAEMSELRNKVESPGLKKCGVEREERRANGNPQGRECFLLRQYLNSRDKSGIT